MGLRANGRRFWLQTLARLRRKGIQLELVGLFGEPMRESMYADVIR
jgi:hypothetical protein